MAAHFFRYFSMRAALRIALCALLLWHSVAVAAITKTRNGITYTKHDGEKDWNQANSACPQGLLWLENQAELDWVISNLLSDPGNENFWLAAKGQVTKWPNGKPFPSDLDTDINVSECACIDRDNVRKINSKTCTRRDEMLAICKPLAAPGCSRSSSASLSFRSIAANRRQSGSELQWITEPSSVACGARCLGDSACCAFEFRVASGRCRLFAAVRAELWVLEEGAEMFGNEG